MLASVNGSTNAMKKIIYVRTASVDVKEFYDSAGLYTYISKTGTLSTWEHERHKLKVVKIREI